MNELNQVKFGLAGGLTAVVFILLLEILLWIQVVPLYTSLMLNLYGVVAYATGYLLTAFALLLIIGFVLGFGLTWMFAIIYNKLLLIKVK